MDEDTWSAERFGAVNPETKEMLTSLPVGVPAVVGYANRLLVVGYLAWLLVVGGTVRRLSVSSVGPRKA